MSAPLLVATLGGSPAPVISAIRAVHPARVLFVATADEGERPGSAAEVPGIVAATGLPADAHETLTVPPDDPDAAFAAMHDALGRLRARHPDARLIADYTGGTKSMSAALLAAALELPHCELQVMSGRRPDLRQVAPGTERPFRVNPSWLLAKRQEAMHRAAWGRFAYAEAGEGFARLVAELETNETGPPGEVERLRDLATLSEGFAAWDRFQHKQAREAFRPLRARHEAWLRPWLDRLDLLCGEGERSEAARLVDLWLNAQRRAARGRFDDAVARCYRLIEWVAQWGLRHRHRIETGNIPVGSLDPNLLQRVGIYPRERQKTKSGLVEALKLLAELEPGGGAARFLTQPLTPLRPGKLPNPKEQKPGERRLRDMLDKRNHSILAHDTKPLEREDWESFELFLDRQFLPVTLRPELARIGIPADPPQLPATPPPGL